MRIKDRFTRNLLESLKCLITINIFAADVDGAGKLNLWNLNNDTELPSATVTVDGPAALNRVSWTQSGLHVVAADDMGKISVYDVGEVRHFLLNSE